MINANEPTVVAVVKQETPAQITTTMILKDLDDGVGREGIKEKYSLETWEVTEMFKNPKLKGKKARKIRKLSFQFIDDTATEDTVDTSEPQFSKREVDEVDPNQTSIPVETQTAFDNQTRVEEGTDYKGNDLDIDLPEISNQSNTEVTQF